MSPCTVRSHTLSIGKQSVVRHSTRRLCIRGMCRATQIKDPSIQNANNVHENFDKFSDKPNRKKEKINYSKPSWLLEIEPKALPALVTAASVLLYTKGNSYRAPEQVACTSAQGLMPCFQHANQPALSKHCLSNVYCTSLRKHQVFNNQTLLHSICLAVQVTKNDEHIAA